MRRRTKHVKSRIHCCLRERSVMPSLKLRTDFLRLGKRAETSLIFSFFRMEWVALYIGDVVGKGLAATMYTALVMGMLRGINKTGEQTSTVLAVLNKRLLVRPVQGRFATTLYAVYDPTCRGLTFSNAGMPYPLRASRDGCQQLKEGGLPSGMFPNTCYDIHRVSLEPDDSVLFATDGLHELRGLSGDDFGWTRMGEIWGQCREPTADESLQCLLHSAKNVAVGEIQLDDITAVALKIPLACRFGWLLDHLNIQLDCFSILNCKSANGIRGVIARRENEVRHVRIVSFLD